MIIALEGVDGSGKRTQTQLLQQRAALAGLSVATLSFPRYGITRSSRTIADYLNGRLGNLEQVPVTLAALMYAGDRAETRDEILELHHNHDILIFDRYVASNLAYQGAKLPIPERREFFDWLAGMEFGAFGLPRPHLNVLLDISVAVASNMVLQKAARSYTTSSADLHETNQDYLETCRQVYRTLSMSDDVGPWSVVNCTAESGAVLPPETICDTIWQAMEASAAWPVSAYTRFSA